MHNDIRKDFSYALAHHPSVVKGKILCIIHFTICLSLRLVVLTHSKALILAHTSLCTCACTCIVTSTPLNGIFLYKHTHTHSHMHIHIYTHIHKHIIPFNCLCDLYPIIRKSQASCLISDSPTKCPGVHACRWKKYTLLAVSSRSYTQTIGPTF